MSIEIFKSMCEFYKNLKVCTICNERPIMVAHINDTVLKLTICEKCFNEKTNKVYALEEK